MDGGNYTSLVAGISLLTIVLIAYKGLMRFTLKALGLYIISLIVLAHYGFISIHTEKLQEAVNRLMYLFGKLLEIIAEQLQKGG